MIPGHIPRVRVLKGAGKGAVELELVSGERVTLSRIQENLTLGYGGLLLTDYRSMEGQAYALTPAQSWEACQRLKLWGHQDTPRHRELDAYLFELPSIQQVSRGEGTLTITALRSDGELLTSTYPAPLNSQVSRHEPGEEYTRFPLQVLLSQGEGATERHYLYRADHSPEGYTALTALGQGRWVPALEEVPAFTAQAAD